MNEEKVLKKVFEDFKKKYPDICKEKTVKSYYPYGFMSIVIYFTDGTKMEFNYVTGIGKVI